MWVTGDLTSQAYLESVRLDRKGQLDIKGM
jgi:hypothetical protein